MYQRFSLEVQCWALIHNFNWVFVLGRMINEFHALTHTQTLCVISLNIVVIFSSHRIVCIMRTILSFALCLSFSNSFSQQNVDTAKANKAVVATLNGYIGPVDFKKLVYCIIAASFFNKQMPVAVGKGDRVNAFDYNNDVRTTNKRYKRNVCISTGPPR